MQFSVIRTYAASRFRDVGLVVVTDADWKNYVNTAYGNALGEVPLYPWNELSTTLTYGPGVRAQNLPTDAWSVTSVYDLTDQFPMIPLEGRNQVYYEYPDQTTNGQPMHYRLFNNALQIYPLPLASTQLIVEYNKMPADLVADADVPVFPSQFHDLLVCGAVALAYKDDGNTGMAAQYDAEFAAGVKQLKVWAMQPRQDRYYEPTDTFL